MTAAVQMTMTATKTAASTSRKGSKLFVLSHVENRVNVEDEMEASYVSLTERFPDAKENELMDALQLLVAQNMHEEVSLGLLYGILTNPSVAPLYFRGLICVTRDNMNSVLTQINWMAIEMFPKLVDSVCEQLLWFVGQMIRTNVAHVEVIFYNLLRWCGAGDLSRRNLFLADSLINILLENRAWAEKTPDIIPQAVYGFLRLIPDHMADAHDALRRKEINFCIQMLRERFGDCSVLGRDLVRLLIAVGSIPQFAAFWKDLLTNPGSLWPQFTGVEQLMCTRASRRFFISRLSFDLERRVYFLLINVKVSNQHYYLDWLEKQFFSKPENNSLRQDVIRYVCSCVHPNNSVLASDVMPRWSFIVWLISRCTTDFAEAQQCKLALFFDWFFFNPEKDSIMNIEPGLLAICRCIHSQPNVTATLLEFLILTINDFFPSSRERMVVCVRQAFKLMLEKGVVPSLAPLFDGTLLPVITSPLLQIIPEGSNTVPLQQQQQQQGVVATTPQPPVMVIQSVDDSSSSSFTEQFSDSEAPLEIYENSTNVNCSSAAVAKEVDSQETSISTPAVTVELFEFEVGENRADRWSKDDEVTVVSDESESTAEEAEDQDEEEEDDDDEEEEEEQEDDSQQQRQLDEESDSGSEKSVAKDLSEPLESLLADMEKSEGDQAARCDQMQSLLLAIFRCDNFDGDMASVLSARLMDMFRPLFSKVTFFKKGGCAAKNSIFKHPLFIVFRNLCLTPEHDRSRQPLLLLLAEMYERDQRVGFLLLYFLCSSNASDKNMTPYADLAKQLNQDLQETLADDLELCAQDDFELFFYMLPYLLSMFSNNTAAITKLVHCIVAYGDGYQLNVLLNELVRDNIHIFRRDIFSGVLQASLTWSTLEQAFFWQLVVYEKVPIDWIQVVIPKLQYPNHVEAMTSICLVLRHMDRDPSTALVRQILSRRPTSDKDLWTAMVLQTLIDDYEDRIAELVANQLNKLINETSSARGRKAMSATGSAAGGAGNKGLTLQQVLDHLDRYRCYSRRCHVFFSKDNVAAALNLVKRRCSAEVGKQFSELFSILEVLDTVRGENRTLRRARRTVAVSNRTANVVDSSSSSSDE